MDDSRLRIAGAETPRQAAVERRKFGRRVVCKPAAILLEERGPLRCAIVEFSAGGALLTLFEDLDLPERFDLLIRDDEVVVHCRLAHCLAGRCGVEFVSLPRRARRFMADSGRIRARVMEALLGEEPAPEASAGTPVRSGSAGTARPAAARSPAPAPAASAPA